MVAQGRGCLSEGPESPSSKPTEGNVIYCIPLVIGHLETDLIPGMMGEEGSQLVSNCMCRQVILI